MRPGRTVSTAAGFRVFYSGSTQGGQHGVALAVKESICKTSKFTREDVNERLMSMRFEMSGQHQAVNFVVGYAPTEPSDSERNERSGIGSTAWCNGSQKRSVFLC